MFKTPARFAFIALCTVGAASGLGAPVESAEDDAGIAAMENAAGGIAPPALEAAAQPNAAHQGALQTAEQRIAVAEHLEAIVLVEAAIEAIERRSNRYAEELVRPLTLLGDALAGVGDVEGAFGAYDRALHIARVNHGLHHPDQVAVVYRQARLLADGGDFRAANARHEYAYTVLLRSHGGSSPALLPGLFALADWYMSGYNIFSARELYEHAAEVAEKRLDDDHPAHIRALRSVAATYRRERFPPLYKRRPTGPSLGSYAGFQYRPSNNASVNSFAKGERALIKVINIVQGRDGPAGEELARAMLELGDWFLMFDKQARAMSLYRRVWELLQNNQPLLAETFHAPTPLYLPLPKPPSGRRGGENGRQGIVELSVDINERGVVSRIATVRSEPPDLMDFKVRRAVKQARYRPAFDGEQPHPTSDLRVKHTFVYYPDGDPASEAARPLQVGMAPPSERLDKVAGAGRANR